MVKDNIFKKILDKMLTNPVISSLTVLVLATSIVVTLKHYFYYQIDPFWQGVFVESYGMLFDILVLGVFVLWLNKKGEKRLTNQRYQEEIDDFRCWESKEATVRIIGNIKRLNRDGVTRINLSGCNLSEAIFSDSKSERTNRGINLSGADLSKAKLFKTDLIGADLSCANLIWANLSKAYLRKANLSDANLSGADLVGANLRKADLGDVRNIRVEQLSKVRTLYEAKLDTEIENELKEKHPELFKNPSKKNSTD